MRRLVTEPSAVRFRHAHRSEGSVRDDLVLLARTADGTSVRHAHRSEDRCDARGSPAPVHPAFASTRTPIRGSMRLPALSVAAARALLFRHAHRSEDRCDAGRGRGARRPHAVSTRTPIRGSMRSAWRPGAMARPSPRRFDTHTDPRIDAITSKPRARKRFAPFRHAHRSEDRCDAASTCIRSIAGCFDTHTDPRIDAMNSKARARRCFGSFRHAHRSEDRCDSAIHFHAASSMRFRHAHRSEDRCDSRCASAADSRASCFDTHTDPRIDAIP